MSWHSPTLVPIVRCFSHPIHLLPTLFCSPLSPPPLSSLTRCAICMMDYCAGEPIRLLPCMHYYHLHCIDDWLMRSLTCPTCMERVDTGLMATLRNTGGGISRGGGRRFSLRRRRRGRGQGDQGSVSESPHLSGVGTSTSSSRSSSTSSSTELLSPGGQFSWPPQSCQQQQHLVPSGIFLPPFPPTSPTPRPTSQNSNISCPPSQNYSDLGPPPTVISSPSSATAVVHPSPPHSPLLPSVTIHMRPTPVTPHPSK